MSEQLSEQPIGLAEAIRQVRVELTHAHLEGQEKDLRFRGGEVQLQFDVAVTREGGGEAGIKLWVVSVGAKGEVTNAKTNTVTVSLLPQVQVAGQWQDLLVADKVAGRPPLK
jgi:Trypsin-co-occurring domain 2